jgi:parallel beta-helix repeat protein
MREMSMRFLAAATFALGLAGTAAVASAETLQVPSDDFPTIQSAVDAAVAGDVILVADGVYAESLNVSGKTGIMLKGKAYPTIQPPGGDGITMASCTDVTVTGFEITGGLMGLQVTGCTNVSFTKLVVSGSTGNAFNMGDNEGVLISRCEVNGSAGSGVVDSSSTDVVLEKCSFTGVSSSAVHLSPYNLPGSGSDRAKVSRNRIEETSSGIFLGGIDLVAEKNRIAVAGYGIYIDASTNPSNALVSKNTIATGGSDSIHVSGSNHRIEKNKVTGGGIYETGFNHVLDRNAVTGGLYGIFANGSSTTVTRNSVRDNAGDGIVINGYFLPVEGNKVWASQGRGIVVNFNGPGPIAGNKVAECDSHGFALAGSGNTLTGNKATNCDGIGFYVTGTGNTFSKNKASGNGDFDLADTNAEGVNTYSEDNRFGTQQIPYVD